MVAAGTADWNGQMERQTERQAGKAELAWKGEAVRQQQPAGSGCHH